MKNSELDMKLYNYYNKIEMSPKFYTLPKSIAKTNYYKNNKTYILKLSIACMLLLMICTVTFGKNIYMSILEAMAEVHEGVSVAINNDYYAEIEMEYANSNKIKLKVSEFIMDDYNLFLGFKIENNRMEEIRNIKFQDMTITDEYNNLIFCDDKEAYDKYCKENNMRSERITEYSLTNRGYGIEQVKQDGNELEVLYKLCSDGYPKSKELHIQIHTIEAKGEKGETLKLDGIWKMKVNVPKEFYERNYITYQVKDGSDAKYGMHIDNMVVTDTQTVVSYKGNYNIDNITFNNTEEEILDFIDNNRSFYDEIKLKNEKGEIFNTASMTDAFGTYYSKENEQFEGRLPFELTKYDITDKIYLIIIKNGEEKVINLER